MKSTNASMPSFHPLRNRNFSHIYVEKEALELPDTQGILRKFNKANLIEIQDYKAVFNRPNQNFQSQKLSMKMILATKKDHFLYEGSRYAPNFNLQNFYYNTLILNCVYNCDYCYLQGLFLSGDIVFFVNSQPFFKAADRIIQERGSIYLCISYDTDLLAFENVIPNCRRWINWAENQPDAIIEIRTKSSNFSAIKDLPPPKNTILAWTLSPSIVVGQYEKKTPALKSRLHSVREALDAGWKVRICIDPILRIQGWKKIYAEMVEEIFDSIPFQNVYDFSIGTFRMNHDYLEKIRKNRFDSSILFYPFEINGKVSSYGKQEQAEMISFVGNLISDYEPSSKVYV